VAQYRRRAEALKSAGDQGMRDEYRHPEALVSTAWLETHLRDPELRVFECTVNLRDPSPGSDAPYLSVSGRADYDELHIAGAGFLDLVNELSDTSGPGQLRFMMPPPEALAETLGRHGLDDGSRVVLYSRSSPQWATRLWWMLRAIGFDAAAVLDGGWAKWRREGRPVSNEEPAFAAGRLTPRPRPGLFVAKEVVREAMADPGTCTINALSPETHRGESARYGRPGRIPGSVNVPAASLVDPDNGTFIGANEAAAAFRAVNTEPSKRTLCYCGGGIAATLDAFLLYQLGYEDVAVYDASLGEWARDNALPIETD
jgi:thiosulfate/3-mercaptopyruvate sulfurtransferase